MKTQRKTVKVNGAKVTLSTNATEFAREMDAGFALVVAGPRVDHDLPKADKIAAVKLGLEMAAALLKDAVRLVLPAGSKESKGYLYTPKVEGKERWFDCRLIRHGLTEDGLIWVEAERRAVKSRGLLHLVTGYEDDLLLSQAA